MTRRILVTATVLLALLAAVPAAAQWQLKAGEDSNIKFGVLLQGWADWQQDAASGGYAQNLFLRRARFIAGGQIVKNVTFFFETDNPNMGKASATGAKGLGTGFIVQDAFLDVKFSDAFSVQGGLILVPFCRNCLSSAAALVALDYGSYSFLESGPTGSVVGRDTGFQARGFFLGNHLEYRVAAFQGARNTGVANNSYRSTGRIQYNIFDTENAFFYPGTYFGKKKILAIGGGYDTQASYYAYSADAIFDWPIAPGSITAEGDFIHYDGERWFNAGATALRRQNTLAAQAGVFIASAKVMPFFRYEHQEFTAPGNNLPGSGMIDQSRYQAGIGYYYKGNNTALKLAYTRVEPKTGTATNQFTIQLQAFYY